MVSGKDPQERISLLCLLRLWLSWSSSERIIMEVCLSPCIGDAILRLARLIHALNIVPSDYASVWVSCQEGVISLGKV